MADLVKVLMDDHVQARKLFRRVGRNVAHAPLVDEVPYALAICERIRLHAALEEELLYPLVRRRLGAALADAAEEDHARARTLVSEIEACARTASPRLARLLAALNREVEAHVETEERGLFPKLRPFTDELFDAGRTAFARMQELLAGGPAVRPTLLAAVNSGWGNPSLGRRDLANTGW